MAKFSELINGEDPVLVDFHAEWCGPCKTMAPILQEVKSDLGGKVRIVKIDIDKNPKTASKFQVQSVPTLILFKGGKQRWRQSGVVPKHALLQVLDQN
ncbi:MAG: thioredoxin [Cyclobacteriaceae bacterium]